MSLYLTSARGIFALYPKKRKRSDLLPCFFIESDITRDAVMQFLKTIKICGRLLQIAIFMRQLMLSLPIVGAGVGNADERGCLFNMTATVSGLRFAVCEITTYSCYIRK